MFNTLATYLLDTLTTLAYASTHPRQTLNLIRHRVYVARLYVENELNMTITFTAPDRETAVDFSYHMSYQHLAEKGHDPFDDYDTGSPRLNVYRLNRLDFYELARLATDTE